jgi:hypothetical protein
MQARAIQLVTRAMARRIEAVLMPIPNFDAVIVGAPNTAKAMRAQIVLFPYRMVAASACIGLLPARRQPTPRVISRARSHAAAADRGGRDRGRDRSPAVACA